MRNRCYDSGIITQELLRRYSFSLIDFALFGISVYFGWGSFTAVCFVPGMCPLRG